MNKRGPAHPPRIQREIDRVELSKRLRSAMEEHGVTQDALAAQVGAGRTQVKRWIDTEAPETISVVDARNAFPEIAVPMAEFILENHGKIAIDRPSVEVGAGSHLTRVHSLLSECGDVTREYTAALSTHGGRITPDERRVLRREIAEAIRALCEADRALELEAEAEAAS